MTSTATTEVKAGRDGRVGQMRFSDGGKLPVDVVVFATGVRPRDELAREAGLEVHERGGIIADEACRTSDESIYAVGEVAFIADRIWGLVGPGYSMAEVVVDRLLGGQATFEGADLSTKLKLLGVDVASFGDAFASTSGSLEVVYADPLAGVYKKLVMSDDASTLLGGMLVGDASSYASLRPMVGGALGSDPTGVAAAGRRRAAVRLGVARRSQRLLLLQRLGRHDPGCRHRPRVHEPRRGQGVHQGRHGLRFLRQPGQEAGRHPAR